MQIENLTEELQWNRWGVPHWKDTSAYAYVEELDPAKLRWEFMRRTSTYRNAWTGTHSKRQPLKGMLDPALNGLQLATAPKFLDTVLAGGPLGLAVALPKLAVLLNPVKAERATELALQLQIGIEVLRLVEAGYVLFVTDPQVAVDTQLGRIEGHLSMMQRESRKSSDSQRRVNSRTKVPRVRLLQVLDAYAQEGPLGENGRRGAKAMIGRTIFAGKQPDPLVQWHKVADRYFKQAEAMAFRPLSI